jgi:hypothetical protein
MAATLVPLTTTQGLARDLPETALHGDVNPPRIDGKDGVAGSIPAGLHIQADQRNAGRRMTHLPSREPVPCRGCGLTAGRASVPTIAVTSVVAGFWDSSSGSLGCMAVQERIPERPGPRRNAGLGSWVVMPRSSRTRWRRGVARRRCRVAGGCRIPMAPLRRLAMAGGNAGADLVGVLSERGVGYLVERLDVQRPWTCQPGGWVRPRRR